MSPSARLILWSNTSQTRGADSSTRMCDLVLTNESRIIIEYDMAQVVRFAAYLRYDGGFQALRLSSRRQFVSERMENPRCSGKVFFP